EFEQAGRAAQRDGQDPTPLGHHRDVPFATELCACAGPGDEQQLDVAVRIHWQIESSPDPERYSGGAPTLAFAQRHASDDSRENDSFRPVDGSQRTIALATEHSPAPGVAALALSL